MPAAGRSEPPARGESADEQEEGTSARTAKPRGAGSRGTAASARGTHVAPQRKSAIARPSGRVARSARAASARWSASSIGRAASTGAARKSARVAASRREAVPATCARRKPAAITRDRAARAGAQRGSGPSRARPVRRRDAKGATGARAARLAARDRPRSERHAERAAASRRPARRPTRHHAGRLVSQAQPPEEATRESQGLGGQKPSAATRCAPAGRSCRQRGAARDRGCPTAIVKGREKRREVWIDEPRRRPELDAGADGERREVYDAVVKWKRKERKSTRGRGALVA